MSIYIRNIGILIFSFLAFNLIGQQSALSTMYMLNPYQYNSSYAGFDKSLSATLSYRSQWTPVISHPKKVHFNVHLPVYALNGGLGLKILSDSNGPEKTNEIGVSYNFVYKMGSGYLSGGGNISIIQKSLFGDEFRTPDGIYEGGINHQDPILSDQTIARWSPSIGLGLMYNSEFMQAGLQIDNIYGLNPEFENLTYNFGRVISLIGAYTIDFSRDLSVKPSFLASYTKGFIQSNIGALAEYGSIFGGLNVRGITPNSFESIGIISGIRFGNHYTLAYSYDLIVNGLRKSSDGTHEIMLKYNLNKLINTGLPPKIIHNPRDL